jgi:polysaccharide biosynthesis/export protein
MKCSNYTQKICKAAAMAAMYLALVSPAWAQGKAGKSNSARPTDEQIASTTVAIAQPPVPGSLSNAATDSGNVPESKANESLSPGKLGSVPQDKDYVIGPQDLLAINVWHEPELSRSVPVRPDGKISLPLVGEFNVSGLTPRLLEAQLAKQLENYVRYPEVTVMIQEANSHKFYIMGQVDRPGSYALTTRMTVLNALATAGGFREFAKVQHIYLLRPMPDGSRKRMPFDYKAVVGGKNLSQDIELQTGDTVVVP